jgi:hypothetical protein
MPGVLSGLSPVTLVHVSLFMPVPYCLDCCSFAVCLEIGYQNASTFLFLVQNSFV